MNHAVNVQNFTTEKEAEEHLKQQLAQYVAQQPESTQATHRLMKRLEAVGVGIIVAAFIFALYVSFFWKSVNPLVIPVAWFTFAGSIAPALIFYGVDAISLRAFPPRVLPGKSQKFVTGSGAVWIGFGFICLALVAAGFWGLFAYATATQNWAMLTPLIGSLGVVLGVVMTISILFGMAQKVFKSR